MNDKYSYSPSTINYTISVEKLQFEGGFAFGIVKRDNTTGPTYLNTNGNWSRPDVDGRVISGVMLWNSRQKADKAYEIMKSYARNDTGKAILKKRRKKKNDKKNI